MVLPSGGAVERVAMPLHRERGPPLRRRRRIELVTALSAAIDLATVRSPYLRGLLRSRVATTDLLLADGLAAATAAAFELARDDARPLTQRLRQAKADIALITALADLAGEWSLERVTRTLAEFADLAVDSAITAAMAERGAAAAGFVALALGKLGSFELNYSSDVDLILLYDPVVIPVRPREEHAEAAVRIARRIVAILQDLTADGYVFRTDLRLRPVPEATPLALPVAAAEHYYQSEALTWERTAFIRARACGGDIGLGRAFLQAIKPFVWRRSLDYTAIADIKAVSLRIRDHYDAAQVVGPGYDLKRGRGGIREIEFFAQIHQLVWGGRDPTLRTPATLDALAALTAAGHVDADDAALLSDAYRWLRTIEHRLQMRADEQTHSVPLTEAAREAVAALSGYPHWAALQNQLGATTAGVATRYDRLIADARATALPGLPTTDDGLQQWFTAAGLPAGAALIPSVLRWRSASHRALRSAQARAAFEALLPELVRELATAANPLHAAARFETFLKQLPAGLQFFTLLEANPKLLPLLGHLLGVTPVLADALAKRPALFDVLLERDSFEPLADVAVLTGELAAAVAGSSLEATLDRVRSWTAERRFQLGAQLIELRADPLRVAHDLASLADAALDVLTRSVSIDFEAVHGRVPGGRLLVLAFGRYGGAALTHASDLDLIYLFTGNHETVSDGAKPLAATLYFGRLTQRLTAALSVPTAAGALYEIDTRLRPSGAKGLLAVSVDSFVRYQSSEAWTWEHMALTRARVVVGNARDRSVVMAAIAAIVAQPRERGSLHRDVLAMRADMARAKPGQGLWDVKLAPGGLVDIEFIVHTRQLETGSAPTPELGPACGAAGLPELSAPHDLMTRLLVVLRLVADGTPGALDLAHFGEPVRELLTQACGYAHFEALQAALADAKAIVCASWTKVFGAARDTEE